jgi:cell wall-associated NlpC family hydrolase
MKKKLTNLFFPLSTLSIILLSTGCVPKNADGTYNSAYSYHPYLKEKKKHHRPISSYRTNNRIPIQQNRYRTVAYHNSLQNNLRPNLIRRYVPNIRPSYNNNNINNNIEKTAKSLLGTDYQYGATGPYQYDCSSFTKYVFSKQGINLPRVSREQAQRGQYVSANQLQKGDLIFFDSKKSAQVSHVGIYLGRGDFIHASSAKDKVTISNLSSNYYSKHFKWGRRVTNLNYAMR